MLTLEEYWAGERAKLLALEEAMLAHAATVLPKNRGWYMQTVFSQAIVNPKYVVKIKGTIV